MNPFHSTPEATAFWRTQREACEAARNTLVKHPSIAAFLRAGGRIEVVPTHIPARDAFCILCKDGDSILCAIPAYLPEGIQTFHRDTVDQLTAWLREALDIAPVPLAPVEAEMEEVFA